MKIPMLDLNDHPGLMLGRVNETVAKLDRFAAAGAAHLYYLFDFDRTLTTSKHTGDNPTTWQIMHDLLSEEGRATSETIRRKYLDLERLRPLSPQESHAFSSSVLDLHAAHGTKWHDIEQAAKRVKLRDGSRELFAACHSAHIPTVILSAGIRNIIEIITQGHDIHPTTLLSIQLQFAPDGRVIGWDKNSLVFTHNKHETVRQRLGHIYSTRPFTVLIGDTLEDPRIVDGDDNVLRIRICDLHSDGPPDESYLTASFEAGYDIVIEEDLAPLVRLTEWLCGART